MELRTVKSSDWVFEDEAENWFCIKLSETSYDCVYYKLDWSSADSRMFSYKTFKLDQAPSITNVSEAHISQFTKMSDEVTYDSFDFREGKDELIRESQSGTECDARDDQTSTARIDANSFVLQVDQRSPYEKEPDFDKPLPSEEVAWWRGSTIRTGGIYTGAADSGVTTLEATLGDTAKDPDLKDTFSDLCPDKKEPEPEKANAEEGGKVDSATPIMSSMAAIMTLSALAF